MMTAPAYQHDQVSGRLNLDGQIKPQYLIDAEIAEDRAWDEYYRIAETYIVDKSCGMEDADPKPMWEAREIALQLSERKRSCYNTWMVEQQAGTIVVGG